LSAELPVRLEFFGDTLAGNMRGVRPWPASARSIIEDRGTVITPTGMRPGGRCPAGLDCPHRVDRLNSRPEALDSSNSKAAPPRIAAADGLAGRNRPRCWELPARPIPLIAMMGQHCLPPTASKNGFDHANTFTI